MTKEEKKQDNNLFAQYMMQLARRKQKPDDKTEYIDNNLENDLPLNILKFLNTNYNDLYYKLFNLNNIILFRFFCW